MIETILKFIINILFLISLFLLSYPTYRWLNDLKTINKKFATILSIIIFLIIITFLLGFRSDLFNYFNIKDYGVEYN